MFSRSETLSHYTKRNVVTWMILAFQAGAINVGGYLACHRFVSHTTGFATTFGAELGQGKWMASISMLSVPIWFLAGAMCSAFFIDRRIQTDRAPLYPVVMGLLFALLAIIAANGIEGTFGEFGASLDLTKDYTMLAGLAMACGLQNATISSAFGSVIRTTHLTGLTTDLGIGLIRVFTHSHKLNTRINEIRANVMRVGIFMGFATGAAIATYFYLHFQYWGFILPALIALGLFVWSVFRYLYAEPQAKETPNSSRNAS